MQFLFVKVNKISVKVGGIFGKATELKELRLKVGLKQREVADIFEISKNYLSMIESGKRKCSEKLYTELKEYYETMNQTEGLEAIFDYVRIR
ncbi:helix-turn-helix domain-containing protein, partial [Enterococcus faecalis]